MQKVSASPYLTREERKMLLQKNDWLAAFQITVHWSWIIFAFALPYFWTNIFTVLISLLILGGKQLACAILMHDTSHRAVFKNNKFNDYVGQWLGAFPIFQDMLKYRPYHQTHHFHNGLEKDPDLLLTRAYPTSRKSMIRKFFRDLTGQTGIKSFAGFIMMNLGFLEYNLGKNLVRVSRKNRSWKNFFITFFRQLGKPILANLILFLTLWSLSTGWLYLLWVVAYFTTFQFSLRVRSMAEHSMVENTTDPYLNTRTTYANFFEGGLLYQYSNF